MRKLFRKVVRIHVAVGGNENLFTTALLYKGKVTAPLVLDPDCIKILRFGTKDDHDLRTVQRSKDVRLVCRAEFILQRDA